MTKQMIKAEILQKYANSKCTVCCGRGVRTVIHYLYRKTQRSIVETVKLCPCIEKKLRKLGVRNFEQFLLKETHDIDKTT
jgi:hypothetical protein